VTAKKTDVLRPVDDDARRLAKTLVRTSRYASLATIEPADGFPSASRVAMATTMAGEPVLLMSGLSGHFRNLEADQRCSLLVGEVGKGDPLAHPRMTLIGRAERIEQGTGRDLARSRYLMRQPKSALYMDFPDFALWKVTPARVSLNGGFGKAYAPEPTDIVTGMQGLSDLESAEASAVAHMNTDHTDVIQRYAASIGEEPGSWRLACLDPEGLDLTWGDRVARLWFDRPLQQASELRPKLVSLAKSTVSPPLPK
jgi:putative heme iron utilization protein